MKPRKFAFLLFVVVCLLAFAGCVSATYESPYSGPRAAVRLLASPDGNGSGVMIAPGVMLTAAHVAEHNADVPLYVEPGHYPIKVEKIDTDNDVALLKTKAGCPCVGLAVHPRVDERVIVVGFPLHDAVKAEVVTEGRVQAVVGNRIVLNADVTFGNSGGGVFVYRGGQWRLIGILVGMATQPGGFGGVPANYLSVAVAPAVISEFLRHG